jgi:hypothetical protein
MASRKSRKKKDAPVAAPTSPDPGPELVGKDPRQWPMPAGCAVVIGGALLLFGVGFPAIAVGMIGGGPGGLAPFEQQGASALVGLVLGPLALLIAGTAFAVRGTRALRGKARARELAARHPGEPWYLDWTWDPAGTGAEATLGTLEMIFVLLLAVLCAIFTPIAYEVARSREPLPIAMRILVVAIVGAFDVLLVRIVLSLGSGVARRFRDGPAHLQFDAFPYALGGSFQGRVAASALAGRTDVTATLRCLTERVFTSHRLRQGRADRVKVYELYSERQSVVGPLDRGQSFPVVFALPSGDLATHLGGPPLRYWELELAAPGADSIRFLVPVY